MNKNSSALSLQEISTRVAKDLPLSKKLVVFPIGSNEQHGPHLPMGTDTIILEAVVQGIRKQLTADDPVVFAPALPLGKSPEHLEFTGTISLRATTLIAILEDIVASMQKHGVKKIVFLNSHGGNTALLTSLAFDLRYTYKMDIYSLNFWNNDLIDAEIMAQIIPDLPYPEIHAASMETSLLLYLRPELVGEIPHDFKPKRPFPAMNFGWATQDLFENGVIGDPRQSSSEHGEKLFQLLVDGATKKIREIAQF
ncbi:MAG: creatininase family protein [Anaerolineaceae bacterium]